MPLVAALFAPHFEFDAAKISIISEPCKHFGRKIFKVPIWHLKPLPLFHRFATVIMVVRVPARHTVRSAGGSFEKKSCNLP